MKNKVVKLGSIATGIFSVFMTFGWCFFEFMIRCKKREKQSKKQWFQLHHTKINHPRYKFEKALKDEFGIDRGYPLDTFEDYIAYLTKKRPFIKELKYEKIEIVEKEREE